MPWMHNLVTTLFFVHLPYSRRWYHPSNQRSRWSSWFLLLTSFSYTWPLSPLICLLNTSWFLHSLHCLLQHSPAYLRSSLSTAARVICLNWNSDYIVPYLKLFNNFPLTLEWGPDSSTGPSDALPPGFPTLYNFFYFWPWHFLSLLPETRILPSAS